MILAALAPLLGVGTLAAASISGRTRERASDERRERLDAAISGSGPAGVLSMASTPGLPGSSGRALELPLEIDLPEGWKERLGQLPSWFETFGVAVDVLYGVYISDGYLLSVHREKREALSAASSASNEKGITEVEVIELRMVPTILAEKLLGQGSRRQKTEDGHTVSKATEPYVYENSIWRWNVWEDDPKRAIVDSDGVNLRPGKILYHGTSDEDPWEQDGPPNTPAWFTDKPKAAAWFAVRSGGPRPRVTTWKVTDIIGKLIEMNDPGDFERWVELIDADEHGIHDIAERTCSEGVKGWIVPYNYPELDDAADILLCQTHDLELVSVEEIDPGSVSLPRGRR